MAGALLLGGDPLASAAVSTAVELARQEWEEGYHRLGVDAGDPRRQARLLEQVEVVTEELRRRVGSTFTMAELAAAYRGAESWAPQAIAERSPRPGWARSVSSAVDAAFHLYSRGARDYRP